MIEVILLLIGLIAGFVSAWFIAKYKYGKDAGISHDDYSSMVKELDTYKVELKVAEEKAFRSEEFLQQMKQKADDKESMVRDLTGQLSGKSADLRNLQEKLESQKQELTEIREQFTNQFRNLANEILEEKSKKFTEQNRASLDVLLKPLGEKIKEFEKKVEEVYDKESKQRFSLEKNILELVEQNNQLSRDAQNLTNALKGESKTQGNWGELVLERILEKSGLVRDREYFVQTSYSTEDGRKLQPDVVVVYPGERNVVIDSKVSLTAYERYCSAENDSERVVALKEHLLSIKTHVQELSAKNYQDLYQINSLDFVMMFIPVEPSYMLAVQNDAELWQYAYERRILIISPTNLIAALKMISSLWQQEFQNRYALEIAQKSGDLYDKFVGFIEDITEIGKKIDATQKSYEAAVNKLYTGKGNLIKRAEDIKALGAKTKKSLPGEMTEKALEADE